MHDTNTRSSDLLHASLGPPIPGPSLGAAAGEPASPARQTAVSILGLAAGLALATIHFLFLLHYFAPAISTPDANGYFAQSRHIADQHRTWFDAASPLQFIPQHWITNDGRHFFSKYPPGLPMIAAGVRAFFGPEASLLVNPVMASLSLLGLFLICRLWIGTGWALLAAAFMAVNAAANQQAMFAFAHTGVAFFLVWGIYFIARWRISRSAFWAFAAGLCFGMLPTIRYAEALYCLAPALCVILTPRLWRSSARSLLAGAIGMAIPTGALALRNQLAFGAFWRTGYSASNEQTGFGLDYFREHFTSYLRTLPSDGAGLVFALGVAGLAVLCTRRATWRRGVLLATVIVPSTLLYMAYYWGPDGMSMRFLVPTFFLYTIAAVWLLKLLSQTAHGPALAASFVLLGLACATGIPTSVEELDGLAQTNRGLADVTGAIRQNVRSGDVILADRQFQQHLDFAGDWRLVDPQFVLGPGREPMGPRFGGDRDDAGPNPGSGRLADERREYYRDFGDQAGYMIQDDLQTWAGKDRRIFWVGTRDQIDQLREVLTDMKAAAPLAELTVPGLGRGPFGGGGPMGRIGPAGGGNFGPGPRRFGPPGFGPMRRGRGPGRGFRGDGPEEAPQKIVIVELTRARESNG